MSKALCIIPARGGSKRIPKKNIKPFHGKPIIAYSIDTALISGLFKEVMVSTDCEEIKRISQMYGAQVPFLRSETNSNDFATTVDVVNEVLEAYRKMGQTFEEICVLYSCAPFATAEDLKKAKLTLEKYDSVIPVVRYDFPPFRSFEIFESKLRYKWPEYEKLSSQDFEDLFHDAGQWYFFRNEEQYHESLVKNSTAPFILDSNKVQDIDTISDWKLAELKFQILNEEV
jgi:N-acylneuraminate cytidylyltransferase